MRLLLVEPHALLARAMRLGLEEEGFAIDAVATHHEANQRVRDKEYDVIVLDLPNEINRGTLHHWRLGGLRTPVLLVTEPETDIDRRATKSSGDIATLNKPFQLDDLLACLQALAGNNGNPGKEPRL
jgi:DNA-binding response OmpR family regulator